MCPPAESDHDLAARHELWPYPVFVSFLESPGHKDPDAKKILPENAVSLPPSLQRQLSELGIAAELEVFLQQRALKAEARKQKAVKQLASALI